MDDDFHFVMLISVFCVHFLFSGYFTCSLKVSLKVKCMCYFCAAIVIEQNSQKE